MSVTDRVRSLKVAGLEQVMAPLGRPDRGLIRCGARWPNRPLGVTDGPSAHLIGMKIGHFRRSLLEQVRGVPRIWPLKPEKLEILNQTVPRFPMRIR